MVFILNYEYIEQDNYQKNSGFCGRVPSVQALPGLLIENIGGWVGLSLSFFQQHMQQLQTWGSTIV